MLNILKSQFMYTGYKKSITVLFFLLFCCYTGFARDYFNTLQAVCPKSHRVVLTVNGDKQKFLVYENSSSYYIVNLVSSGYELFQCVDDRWQYIPDKGQSFLLRKTQPDFNNYEYALMQDSDTDQIYTIGSFPKENKVILSRDGNNLLSFNNNNVSIYDIDRTKHSLSSKPIFSYTPDSGQEIIPETLTTNDDSCVSFQERSKGSSDTGEPAFISDDGFRKLQNRLLYVYNINGWGDGIWIPSGRIKYSDNLQYFVHYWQPNAKESDIYYGVIYQYDTKTQSFIRIGGAFLPGDGFGYFCIKNDGTTMEWRVPGIYPP